MTSLSEFVDDIWYFAGLSTDFPPGEMRRCVIAEHPIVVGRRQDGTLFALRDICPHRAAPLSAGAILDDTVECPYHGWRFKTDTGACSSIPALCADHTVKTEKIKVRTYPIQQDEYLVWIYISQKTHGSQTPSFTPPTFRMTEYKPVIDDHLVLNCHVDHAVVGLMDPAHGPYVHRQWWWRSERSMHEKSKAFEPRDKGFAMAAHSPSSNSFAYKLLGGKPITEISFRLPGIRTEEIKIGAKTLLSFTAVTPIDEKRTHIRQLFFTDKLTVKLLAPLIAMGARAFLRQDGRMVDLQQSGLQYNPRLMLIEDADTQAKWYYAIKKEWKSSRKDKRAFKNPVKARTLRWRS